MAEYGQLTDEKPDPSYRYYMLSLVQLLYALAQSQPRNDKEKSVRCGRHGEALHSDA